MVSFERPDFIELLQVISHKFKTKLTDNLVQLPAAVGKGYIWAEKLPCGISVMVSDTSYLDDFSVLRHECQEHSFMLQFTEVTLDEKAEGYKHNLRRLNDHIKSSVKLSHTLAAESFSHPATTRMRCVKFFFNKSHLSLLVGKNALDEMLTQYFPVVIKNETLEPIATDYRIMLDQLLMEKIIHPLRINHIQNRVLLLLERFIINLHNRKDIPAKKVKRSDEETVRLMKVEALLVKNFAVSPPTIDELSRISAMSPTKLKNDFKMLYGLPIYEYYQKNRMLRAKSLLLLGKYSIKEVGMMVGYSNLSHFANTFKKEFGHLPSELAARDGVLLYN
ncbi:MAG: AraC family transcriptional regulator [Segetibacter sp.]|nr:AraC family transcriptional regulator [Segetibacter sp.]